MSVEDKLKRYQDEIAKAKTQNAKLVGEKEAILKRLSDEHDLSGKEEARRFVESETREKERLEDDLDTILQSIKKKYGFE